MTRQFAWPGSDLGPLPEESSLSVLMRFAWRNAVDHKQLSELLSLKQRIRPYHFTCLDWFGPDKFFYAFGWALPQKEESNDLAVFRDLERFFFETTLRICPDCISSAFHSHWHQFTPLERCPFHGCKLQTVCPRCGEKLPDYSLNLQLFKKPYHCSKCSGCFSDEKMLMSNHLRLRSQSDALTNSFNDLRGWIATVPPAAHYLRSLQQKFRIVKDPEHTWNGLNNCARDILLSYSSCRPAGLSNNQCEITMLTWKVAMNDPRQEIYKGMPPNHLYDLVASVYCSTIRLLHNWIIGIEEVNEGTANNYVEYKNGILHIENVSPYVAAFHLMKKMFEAHELFPLQCPQFISNLRFENIPCHYAHGRQPRVAWRALFLSIFASMFWAAKNAKRTRSQIVLREVRADLANNLSTRTIFDHDGEIMYGSAVFPTVPLLPLSPFTETTFMSASLAAHRDTRSVS